MRRRLAALLLASALALPGTARPFAPLNAADVDALVRALLVMVKIWNAMWGGGSWDIQSGWGGSTWMPGYGGWPTAMPGGPVYPYAMTPPSFSPGMPLGGGGPFAPAWSPLRQGAALNGTWAGSDGTVLRLAGDRVAIASSDGQIAYGRYRTRGNQLIIQSAYSGVTQPYRLELRPNMLALQDQLGNIQIYQRVNGIVAGQYP